MFTAPALRRHPGFSVESLTDGLSSTLLVFTSLHPSDAKLREFLGMDFSGSLCNILVFLFSIFLLGLSSLFLVSLQASAVVPDRVYFETLLFSKFFTLLLLSYTSTGAFTLPCNDLLLRPPCCTS